jgi:hypothetical protein
MKLPTFEELTQAVLFDPSSDETPKHPVLRKAYEYFKSLDDNANVIGNSPKTHDIASITNKGERL